jgi:hypothetical protein
LAFTRETPTCESETGATHTVEPWRENVYNLAAMKTARFLPLAVILVACNHTPPEEPFLTPTPTVPAPARDGGSEGGAAADAGAPQPAAPQPQAQPQPAPPQPAAPEQAGQPTEIRASHILVMYHGSMRAPDSITRTRDEARARAEEALGRVRRGEDFAAVARQYSDEPGASQSGGALPRFRHGMMVPPFEQAAFALPVGGVSGLVETPFGFHVIKRFE